MNLREISDEKRKNLNKSKINNTIKSKSLKGLKVCITDTDFRRSRLELYNAIETLGGINCLSVTKNTNLLLIGTDPGQSKLNKAQQYNIPTAKIEEYIHG